MNKSRQLFPERKDFLLVGDTQCAVVSFAALDIMLHLLLDDLRFTILLH